MATPVNNLTHDKVYAEFGKLTNAIAAKHEELLLGEFGEATSDKFTAKVQELSPLDTRMSELCKRLNLPWPKNLWRPSYFKHWSSFGKIRMTVKLQLHCRVSESDQLADFW